MIRRAVMGLVLAMMLATALPALAQETEVRGKLSGSLCCEPPRFQVYMAPKPYGGLIMIDTKTGDSWQRVRVNTAGGIEIRWLKLKRVESIPAGQVIIWD